MNLNLFLVLSSLVTGALQPAFAQPRPDASASELELYRVSNRFRNHAGGRINRRSLSTTRPRGGMECRGYGYFQAQDTRYLDSCGYSLAQIKSTVTGIPAASNLVGRDFFVAIKAALLTSNPTRVGDWTKLVLWTVETRSVFNWIEISFGMDSDAQSAVHLIQSGTNIVLDACSVDGQVLKCRYSGVPFSLRRTTDQPTNISPLLIEDRLENRDLRGYIGPNPVYPPIP